MLSYIVDNLIKNFNSLVSVRCLFFILTCFMLMPDLQQSTVLQMLMRKRLTQLEALF